MSKQDFPRVLSVQSHVVSGYCGNKSATFPLQILGFDVDPINSVQLSNHTGYKHVKGQILTNKDLDDLVVGLDANNLDDSYTHLLTGYIGSVSFLERIAALVVHLKKKNPNLKYVCDPVMGDNGMMYVPEELLPVYREKIIPLADIITPNQFEMELLTDQKITSVETAWRAIDVLHRKGCDTVVMSSSELGPNNNLLGIASRKLGKEKKKVTIEIPRLPAAFTGTGDLFASLFLAWMHKTNNVQASLERCVATIQAVLKRTLIHAAEGESPRSMELKLVQSREDIEEPKIEIKSELVIESC